jgi:hypothetical protein
MILPCRAPHPFTPPAKLQQDRADVAALRLEGFLDLRQRPPLLLPAAACSPSMRVPGGEGTLRRAHGLRHWEARRRPASTKAKAGKRQFGKFSADVKTDFPAPRASTSCAQRWRSSTAGAAAAHSSPWQPKATCPQPKRQRPPTGLLRPGLAALARPDRLRREGKGGDYRHIKSSLGRSPFQPAAPYPARTFDGVHSEPRSV